MEYTSEIFTLSKIDDAVSEGGISYFIQSNTKVIKRYNKESLSIYEIILSILDKNEKKVDIQDFTIKASLDNITSGNQVIAVIKRDGNFVIDLTSNENKQILENLIIEDGIIYLELLKSNIMLNTFTIQCTAAEPDDYAALKILANQIQASVDGAGLIFDSAGLTVSNNNNSGAITVKKNSFYTKTADEVPIEGKQYYTYNPIDRIYTLVDVQNFEEGKDYYEKNDNPTSEEVFRADANGNVYIKGEIEATSGKIGQIQITENGDLQGNTFLISNNDGITISKGNFTDVSLDGTLDINGGLILSKGFRLDGTSGDASFNSIDLTGKIIIKEEVDGKTYNRVKIQKPESADNTFFVVNNIQNGEEQQTLSITTDGKIIFGPSKDNEIVLDGTNATIYGGDQLASSSWYIDKDGAIFNNITVRGSIKSSVLEYGKVQAIGGALLIRPSSSIKKIRREDGGIVWVTLENVDQFEVNDFCCIGANTDKGASHYQILDKQGNEIKFSSILEAIEIGDIVTSLYNSQDGVVSNNFGIGLNASDNDSFLKKQALTLFEYNKDSQQQIQKKELVILGEIPEINGCSSYKGSYGLYAENALINGAIISYEYNDQKGVRISGINSKSTVDGLNLFGNNKGKIVLWAGAPDENRISEAPFSVDSNGNLYAGSGYFKGAIITESTIEAAEVRTMVLTGIGQKNNDSEDRWTLDIRADTSRNSKVKGIRFYEGEVNQTSSGGISKNAKVFLTLTSEAFTTSLKTNIQDWSVDNNVLKLKKESEGYIQLKSTQIKEDKISFSNGIAELKINDISKENPYLSVNVGTKEYLDFGKQIVKSKVDFHANKIFLDDASSVSNRVYIEGIGGEESENYGFDIIIV